MQVYFLIATVLSWSFPTRHIGLVFSFVHWIWKTTHGPRVGHEHLRSGHFLLPQQLKQSGSRAPAPCKSSNHNCTGSSSKLSARITPPRASTTQANEEDAGICGMSYIYTCHTHLKVWQQNNITLIWYIVVFVKEAGVGSDLAKKCMLAHSYQEVWSQQSLH